jgi:hypothetical protein
MNTESPAPNPVPSEDDKPNMAIDEIILVAMVILSLIGVGIIRFYPQDAFIYWLAMNFVFGLAAMVAGRSQALERGHVRGHLVKELLIVQSLHWLGSLLAVFGAFILLQYGRMSSETAGLVILLILGLATFLDGIRIGWRFSLAGVYLGTTAIIATVVENFMPWQVGIGFILIALTSVPVKLLRRLAGRS